MGALLAALRSTLGTMGLGRDQAKGLLLLFAQAGDKGIHGLFDRLAQAFHGRPVRALALRDLLADAVHLAIRCCLGLVGRCLKGGLLCVQT